MVTERFEHNFPGYEILSQLGRGNARVLKARNQITNELVAIKHFALNTDGDTLRRFQRESEIMKSLKHPNIVKIKEIRLEAHLPYIVMELIEGGDLRNLLKQRGSLDVPAVVALAIQISRAFKIIHDNGITHRDIKPENIMFRHLPNGELHFLLTDFGIAKLREQSNTVTGTSMMTYEYASPEQYDDPRSVTSATDYYSLGVVLYECLSGNVPFPLRDMGMVPFIHKVLHELPPPVLLPPGKFSPPTLDLLIRGLLAKKKQDRITNPDKVERMSHRAVSEGPDENRATLIPATATGPIGKPNGSLTIPGAKIKKQTTGHSNVNVLIFFGIIVILAIMIMYIARWKSKAGFLEGNIQPDTVAAVRDPIATPVDSTITVPATGTTPGNLNVHPRSSPHDTLTNTIEYSEGKYVGQTVGDIMNGFGTFFWNDGDRYSGYFVNGEREGKGTYYFKNRDQYTGDWKKGKKNGSGILYSSDFTYDGEFADDNFEGFGTLSVDEKQIVTNCSDCKTYKGYWKADMKEGFGECFDKDGLLLYQGNFKEDKPEGNYPNVDRAKK